MVSLGEVQAWLRADSSPCPAPACASTRGAEQAHGQSLRLVSSHPVSPRLQPTVTDGRAREGFTAGRAQERRDAQRALDGVRQLYELDHQGSVPNQCSQSPLPLATPGRECRLTICARGQDGERFWKLPEAYIRGNNVSSPLPSNLCFFWHHLCIGSKQVGGTHT